jgi:hypothetical protein
MVIGTINAWGDDPYVPLEITSDMGWPPYGFTHTKNYNVVFKTDVEALEGILPEGFIPRPGYEDYARIWFGRYQAPAQNGRPYWEMGLTVPAEFMGAPVTYYVQLYLGSIGPESSVLPTVAGREIYGLPKREGIFFVMGNFGGRHVKVQMERFGNTVFQVALKKKAEAPGPCGNCPPGGPGLALEANRAADGDGWDVLQVLRGGGSIPGCIPYVSYESKGADVWFTGDIVLDTGRVIPVNEIVYATYSEYDFCMAWNIVVHDYLADE